MNRLARSHSVTIQPAIITVTASSHTRVYGDTDIPAPTPSYTGWVNGNDNTILTTQASCTTTYSQTSTVAAGATPPAMDRRADGRHGRAGVAAARGDPGFPLSARYPTR